MKLPFGYRLTLSRGLPHESRAELVSIRQSILLLTKVTMDSLSRLQAAVAANTAATTTSVARINASSSSPAAGIDPALVDAAAATIEANTSALIAALNAPAPEPVPAADAGVAATS